MKAFFEQCLKDLEALTGKRQLAFWEMEAAKSPDAAKEGDRLIKVCIEGMLFACREFAFIPDDHKKRIIREQMVKDLVYDSLNGRTVYKWLAQAAAAYRTHSQFSEEDLIPRDENGNPTKPAPPEVAAKYEQQLLASLAWVGNQLPTVNELVEHIGEVKRVETGRQKFVIEGIEIYAMSREEAQKAFDATFK